MDGVRCLDVAARGKRDRGSQATIADHVRQTYSIKSTTTITQQGNSIACLRLLVTDKTCSGDSCTRSDSHRIPLIVF